MNMNGWPHGSVGALGRYLPDTRSSIDLGQSPLASVWYIEMAWLISWVSDHAVLQRAFSS